MANPQRENGYTAIANELLEHIYISDFTGTQLKIIFCICRYTYGFNRKSHGLSISFISQSIMSTERVVHKEIKRLIENGVVEVIAEGTFTTPRVLSINKNYEQWIRHKSQHMFHSTTPVLQDSTTPDLQDSTTPVLQDSTTPVLQDREEIKKKEKRKKDARAFFDTIWKLYPEKKGKAKVSEKSIIFLFDLGYDVVKKCIDRYIGDKPDWKQYQHGSTFFNSGYIDYLDENYLTNEQPEQPNTSERGNF